MQVGDFGEATDVGEGAADNVMLKSMRGTARYHARPLEGLLGGLIKFIRRPNQVYLVMRK